MAAGTLPRVGSEHGPCVDACYHPDCLATREMAASRCRLCGMPIGTEVGFYVDPDGDNPHTLVHAFCLEMHVDGWRRVEALAIEVGGSVWWERSALTVRSITACDYARRIELFNPREIVKRGQRPAPLSVVLIATLRLLYREPTATTV